MSSYYKSITRRSLYTSRILYLVVFSAAFLSSSALHAEKSPEIARYTLQREKTSEFTPSTLSAGSSAEIEITEQSGAYQIKVVAIIDAPTRYVRHVLTDYRHIYRLNPSIIESEVLKQDGDGSVTVRTRVVGCAGYFCEELDRVEKVRVLPSGDLFAEIIPELSEFKSGQTHWRIKSLGEHCEVTYLSDMEPDVFIPPIVGKFLIKKSISQEMQISFANLEKISSAMAERKWLENHQPVTTAASDLPCNNNSSISFDACE